MGLFERIDPTRHEVSLLVLQGENSGPLGAWVPDHVRVIMSSDLYRAATLPKSDALRSVALLVRALGVYRGFRLLWTIFTSVIRREPRTRLRQRVWVASRGVLPKVPGSFDLAIGILGQSTYAAVDLCEASHKYHWVRSDSRILQRDETIEESYFRKLSGVLAVSQSCADIFEEMYPSMSGLSRVYKNDIPVGPDPGQFNALNFADGSIVALTIGRLDNLKGIDLAIDACAILRENGVPIKWIVLGEGSWREALESQIAARDLGEHFHLVGNVLDTREFMARADVYVHPSRTEGRSNAVEEARAMGKPIVAGNSPTVRDQVEDGVSGLITPLHPESIARAVLRILGDEDLRNDLGSAAKRAYQVEQGDANGLLDELSIGLQRANSVES